MISIRKIKSSTIVLELPLSNRGAFLEQLRSVAPGNALFMSARTGERVSFIRNSGTDFSVDATKNDSVELRLPNEQWQDLIDAIQEHIDEDGDLPLDHSFEPYGAAFFPSSLKDLVIETVEG